MSFALDCFFFLFGCWFGWLVVGLVWFFKGGKS